MALEQAHNLLHLDVYTGETLEIGNSPEILRFSRKKKNSDALLLSSIINSDAASLQFDLGLEKLMELYRN